LKTKSTLILALAVAAAGLLAYTLSREPPSGAPTVGRSLLPGLKAEKVDSLTIERDGERLVCRRLGGVWRVVEPVAARADAERIEGLLRAFEVARSAATIEVQDGALLTPYGLQQPALTLTIAATSGAWTVRFGSRLPVGNLVYVIVDGRRAVETVDADLLRRAELSAAEARSKRLAPRIPREELRGLSLSTPNDAFECRRSDDRWEMTAPVRDLADPEAVAAMAESIYAHSIAPQDAVAGTPAEHGLDDPDLTVTLSGSRQTQTILFRRGPGDGAKWFASLRGEPDVVSVPAQLPDALVRGAADLRERRLAPLDVNSVARIELAGPHGRMAIVRRRVGWRIEGAEPTPADEDVVTGLLEATATARVAEFLDDPPADLTLEETTRVTFRDDEGRALAEIALSRDGQTGEVYAARPPYPAVLRLSDGERLDGFLAGRLGFLNRLLLRENPADAVEVTLRNEAGNFRVVRDESGAGWRLAAPVAGPADSDAVDDILSALARLRAEAFAADAGADRAEFGLDDPRVTARVAYRRMGGQAPAVRTLHIGAPAAPAAGSYASLGDDGPVFILSETVADRFRVGLASKAICRTEEPIELVFRAGDSSAVFRYDAARRVWTGPTGVQFFSALALLRDFRGRAVADYVEKTPLLYGFDKPYLEIILSEPLARGKRVIIGKRAPGGGRYARGPVTGFVLIAGDADVATLRAVLDQSYSR